MTMKNHFVKGHEFQYDECKVLNQEGILLKGRPHDCTGCTPMKGIPYPSFTCILTLTGPVIQLDICRVETDFQPEDQKKKLLNECAVHWWVCRKTWKENRKWPLNLWMKSGSALSHMCNWWSIKWKLLRTSYHGDHHLVSGWIKARVAGITS